MKNTIIQGFFKVLCLALISLTTLTLNAQRYKNLSQEEKEQKSIALINEADYFILGSPVDSECFYGKDGKTIYTKIKIKVKHWYKGKGERIIYFVRRGGIIGKDNQIIRHLPGPGFHFDKEYFLLLDKEGENYKFGKNIPSFGRYSDTRYDDFKIIAFYGMKFSSIDNFNEFVRNLEGIKVPNKKRCWFRKSKK